LNALSPAIVLTDTAFAGRPEAKAGIDGKPPTPEMLGRH